MHSPKQKSEGSFQRRDAVERGFLFNDTSECFAWCGDKEICLLNWYQHRPKIHGQNGCKRGWEVERRSHFTTGITRGWFYNSWSLLALQLPGPWDLPSLWSAALSFDIISLWKIGNWCSGSSRTKSNSPGDSLGPRWERELNCASRLRVTL